MQELEVDVSLSDILTLRVDEGEREVYVTEDLTADLCADVVRSLRYLDGLEPGMPIRLVISSEGGDWDAALGLLDIMASLRSPVNGLGYGTVASAAAALLISCARRVVGPNTQLMLHAPYVSTSKSGGTGLNPQDLRKLSQRYRINADGLQWTADRLEDILVGRTTLSDAEVKHILTSGLDVWYHGGAAIISSGMADALLEQPGSRTQGLGA